MATMTLTYQIRIGPWRLLVINCWARALIVLCLWRLVSPQGLEERTARRMTAFVARGVKLVPSRG